MLNARRRGRLALLGLALIGPGCGGSTGGGGGEPRERIALAEVGEVYRLYSADHNRPPQTIKDLAVLRPAGPTGIGALEAGDVVLQYGAVMADTAEGQAAASSDQVLAYEKQAPTAGGAVLLLDRTIRAMTADEFKAAPKAGK